MMIKQLEKNNLLFQIKTIIFPITMQNLISAAVNTSDVIMIGRLNQTALSSVSLANQVVMILLMFFTGLSSGIIIMAAQYYGKGKNKIIETLYGMGLRVSLLVTILFMLMAIGIPAYLMRIYTNDPILIHAGAGYLKIVGWSYLFMGFSQIYECIMKSMGRAKKAMRFSAIALFVNISLNACLIFGLFIFPELGIYGAAIATVCARMVEMGFCFWDAYHNNEICLRPSAIFLWNTTLFLDFKKYSLPALGNEFLWGAGFSCYTIVLGHMGSDIIAANSIVSAARNLCSVFVFGIGYGTAIIIGNDIGAGRIEFARKNAKKMLFIVFLASLSAGLFLILLRAPILKYTALTPEARYDLKIMLWINCIYILGMGMNTTFICGLFRAGGDSRFGFILDTIAMWLIFVPLAFICAFFFHVSALIVYVLTCSDEFLKLPINIFHYKKDKWIQDITRKESEILR